MSDARQNPFRSLTDAEYELFRSMIREDVAQGVKAGLAEPCTRDCDRVQGISRTNILMMVALLAAVIGQFFR